MIKIFASLIAIAILLPGTAMAASYEDGIAAFERGDYRGSLTIWQLLAEQGDSQSQFALGLLHLYGKGVAASDLEAVRWFRKSAEANDARAQNSLGEMYRDGRGTQRSSVQAAFWFRKSASNGNANAQTNLLSLLEDSEVAPTQWDDDWGWLERAAERGSAIAQFAIGKRLSTGSGVRRDEAAAIDWFRKSAEQGYAPAQTALAHMYAGERGIPSDDLDTAKRQAFGLFMKAAKQGDAAAQFELGSRYFNGEGVPQDFLFAHMWWNLAAASGHDGARRRRDEVATHMSHDQINEAQRLAREWTLKDEPSAEMSLIDLILRRVQENCTVHGEVYSDVDHRGSGYGEIESGSLSCN